MTTLAPTLEAFFTRRLIRQRRASPHTISAYRDSFRLLLAYADEQTGKPPAKLALEDLDGNLIGGFLDHLERERGSAVSTRNARLAAIHSFFRYAALQHPEHAELIQRVLAIPPKRTGRAQISYLTRAEIDALLAAPDRRSPLGRRDHTLLLLALESGLRVSELTALRCGDVSLRCQRLLHRQRQKAARHPAQRRDRGRPLRLARRNQLRPNRAALPRPARTTAQPRRGQTDRRPAHHGRRPQLPLTGRQADNAARAPAQHRDAAARSRSRHRFDSRGISGCSRSALIQVETERTRLLPPKLPPSRLHQAAQGRHLRAALFFRHLGELRLVTGRV